jgi:prophage antirepressor-like protein
MEALGQPVDAITVTVRRGGVEEPMLGLSSVDLANCLEYATGSKAISKLLSRHADELEFWVLRSPELSKHEPPHSGVARHGRTEKAWIVGPGLDLVLMLSNRPKAKAFRAWLSERSLELRTKGVTYASPDARPALEPDSATSAALLRMTEITARLAESSMAMQERMVATLERLEGRLSERQSPPVTKAEPAPPPPEPRFVEHEDLGDELPDGWATAQQLARRVGWFSKASKGRLPHPQAVVLAALNDGFAQDPSCFATRDRLIEGSDGPRCVPQRVFTGKGVERFLRNVAPLYQAHESFSVQPNYRALKAGQRGVQSVVRQSID